MKIALTILNVFSDVDHKTHTGIDFLFDLQQMHLFTNAAMDRRHGTMHFVVKPCAMIQVDDT